jgi:hypothetical protein
MMFPCVHVKQFTIKDAPPGILGVVTCPGWVTGGSFVDVMKHSMVGLFLLLPFGAWGIHGTLCFTSVS